MSNPLLFKLHNLLAPLVGEIVASTTIQSQCSRMGVDAQSFSAENLATIAERLEPAVKIFVGADKAAKVKQDILALGRRGY